MLRNTSSINENNESFNRKLSKLILAFKILIKGGQYLPECQEIFSKFDNNYPDFKGSICSGISRRGQGNHFRNMQ